jgi:nucleoside phosphorylase
MKVDIGIITIREDEFEAVLQRFNPAPYREPGKRGYGICHIKTNGGHQYAIAIARASEQGNDTSQRLAYDMIRDLNPRLILVVGIAGGVPDNEFTLGDVIISSRIHNLDVGAQRANRTSSFDIRGGIHPVISDITANLLLYRDQLAGWNKSESIGQERPDLDPQQVTIEGGDKEWRKKVQESLDLHFGTEQEQDRQPRFKTGTIASSNRLMRDPLTIKQWHQIARTILAVEMEAAGVYEAAQAIDHQVPIMTIRGISDIVGLNRDSRWTAYACQTAAAFTYAFVMTNPMDPSVVQLSKPNLLLVTNTQHEMGAILDLSKINFDQEFERRFVGQKTYYYLGAAETANVFMVLIDADERAGAFIKEGLQILSPTAVVMVGLAFGAKRMRQDIGDILVSDQVIKFDIDRVGSGPDGEMKFLFRRDNVSASRRLLDKFRDGALDWGTRVHFGALLSGSILIDNEEFRDRLLDQIGSTAIGGELGQASLYVTLAEHNIDWISVREIASWADGNKNPGGRSTAIDFVFYVLQRIGL